MLKLSELKKEEREWKREKEKFWAIASALM